jgi:hypothetical protein
MNPYEAPIKTYSTKAQALVAKKKLDTGTYYLSHGEYERPTYRVRKMRNAAEYYIRAEYFYYSNTFYAKQSGPMTEY